MSNLTGNHLVKETMKKILMWAVIAITAFSFDSFSASAKDVTGMRMEIAESEEDDNEMSLFTYKDQDGTLGYYLSLGRVFRISDILFDNNVDNTFDHIDEVCLCLGTTADEALESLNTILALYDEDVNTVAELPARMCTGSERLGDFTTINCVVKKKFLKGKYLQFNFVSGKHSAEADLGKTTVKFLKKALELDMKRHKKN